MWDFFIFWDVTTIILLWLFLITVVHLFKYFTCKPSKLRTTQSHLLLEHLLYLNSPSNNQIDRKKLRSLFPENSLANHKLGFMETNIFATVLLKGFWSWCHSWYYSLKIMMIYWMTRQNLVKHTTIMERHISYCKNLNLTF